MSKLGTHTGQGPTGLDDYLSQTAAAGSPVPLLFALDINLAGSVADHSPTTQIIFRTQKFGSDNGNMYAGDPIAAGRAWVDTCYPEWLKNPANYYAPINEPGRSDVVGLTWLCNFYLGCMQRADELGVKLCVGEWSTGMPPLSTTDSADIASWLMRYTSFRGNQVAADLHEIHLDIDHEPDLESATATDYISIYLPMLRYAAAHGHILGLHEYSLSGPMQGSPLCLRYRTFRALLPADAQPLFAITEAGSGAGYGTALWDQEYINDAGWYDQQVMQDNYVFGVCLFKYGTGESNLTPVIPQLTQWVITHPAEQEPEPMSKLCGVHSRAGGGDLTVADMATLTQARPVLTSVKFTTQDARANHAQVQSLGIPAANCFVRIYWDVTNITTLPSAQQFYTDVCRLPILECIADGIVCFEFLNEPNHPSEWKWGATAFVAFAQEVIAIIRANHPQAKIISPGLWPNAATVTEWDTAFIIGGLYATVDGIGAHAYGTQPAHLNDDEELRYYRRFASRLSGTQKLWITEASLKNYTITPYEVGKLYGEYIATLEDYVQGAWFFVLQGASFAASGEEWVTRPDIARGLKEYIPPAPPPSKKFGHYHLDNGAADATNPISITMNSAHTLLIDSAPVVVRYPLTISNPDNLAYTVTPASPDGMYEQGTVVRVQTT